MTHGNTHIHSHTHTKANTLFYKNTFREYLMTKVVKKKRHTLKETHAHTDTQSKGHTLTETHTHSNMERRHIGTDTERKKQR